MGIDPPFPYRAGERVAREVRLQADLTIPNETKTRNKREQYAAQAMAVFQHNPIPIKDLRAKVDALVDQVAAHPNLEMLDAALQSDWKLTPEQFASLRTLVPDAKSAELFRVKWREILQPIVDKGILDEKALPNDPQRETRTIEIFQTDRVEPDRARMDDVLLGELSSANGPFWRRLADVFKPDVANTLFQLVVPRLRPTLTYDEPRTQANKERERQKASPEVDAYARGFLVVEQNATISEEHLVLLRAERDALRLLDHVNFWTRTAHRWLGTGILVFAVFLLMGYYLAVAEPRVFDHPRRFAVLCLVAPLTVGLVRLATIEPYRAEILPLSCASLLLTLAYHRRFALPFALALTLLVCLRRTDPMSDFLVLFGGTSLGILLLDGVRSRHKLILVGCISGLGYGLLAIAVNLAQGQALALALLDGFQRAFSGAIAGLLMSGALPFIESLFGIVTDVSLKELDDTGHPLLRELIRRAPGTYNHSATVSMTAEAAAKAIGANAQLIKVGALYHDVGKMLKPQYFIENKNPNERNRHESLEPAMSTLIIIGHVKDGADLARQHHLPQPIIDLIEQHHGTTLVDYFYYEATHNAKSCNLDESVEESSFRYPGPRPQSREAAVLMLSDCVESASRALSEPTPARIEKLVRQLSLNRLLDGQFDESGLSLREIRRIEDSLIKSMNSVYHGRIKYPSAAAAGSSS